MMGVLLNAAGEVHGSISGIRILGGSLCVHTTCMYAWEWRDVMM